MNLKIYLIRNFIVYFSAMLLTLGLVSCTPRIIKPSPAPTRIPIPERTVQIDPIRKEPEIIEKPKPRMIASLQLTQQAQSLIKAQKADQAIRVLERAVSIDPSNGRNYYYLSEAWLIKGNIAQARTFNELASSHLDADTNWQEKIFDQKQRIEALENEEHSGKITK